MRPQNGSDKVTHRNVTKWRSVYAVDLEESQTDMGCGSLQNERPWQSAISKLVLCGLGLTNIHVCAELPDHERCWAVRWQSAGRNLTARLSSREVYIHIPSVSH